MSSPRVTALPGLSAAHHLRHPLHGEDRVWVEKNCYIDVWIELLHSLKLEPLALMPFTLSVDFEGDHWTFFKPSLGDLRTLYGIDVQELNIWRPLIEHAREHLGAGRLLSTEADAWWLPDTAGTDYRQAHVKTTIVLNELDTAHERLGYFHNAGYYTLEGEDFRQLFSLTPQAERAHALPLYAELIRLDRLQHRPEAELGQYALTLLKEHHALRPVTNPVTRFAARFAADLPSLQAQGLPHYHAWAFTTIRQLGAAFELGAAHLRWLAPLSGLPLVPAAESFEVIAHETKALILKAARVVNAKRALDVPATLAPMEAAWAEGMGRLGLALSA